GHERRLVAEEIGERDRAALAPEAIVLRHFAARRQRAPLLRDPLDMTPELDLLGQQRIARPPIVITLVRKTDAVLLHQFDRRCEMSLVSHDVSSLIGHCARSTCAAQLVAPLLPSRKGSTVLGRAGEKKMS